MLVEINKYLFEIIDTQYINNMYSKDNKYFIDLKIEYIELFRILGIIKIKGTQEKTIQLVVYKEKLNYKGFMIYTCKLIVNNQIILLKNDTNIFKCINRVNKKDFSLTIFKDNLRQFSIELENYYNNKIELIKLV